MFGRGRPSAPVNVGDELDVKIEAVGEKGDGISKKDGFVLFVPGVKEGDEVKIKVTRVLRNVGFAEVMGKGSVSKKGKAPQEEEETEEEAEKEEDIDTSEDSEDFGEEETEEETSEDEDVEEDKEDKKEVEDDDDSDDDDDDEEPEEEDKE